MIRIFLAIDRGERAVDPYRDKAAEPKLPALRIDPLPKLFADFARSERVSPLTLTRSRQGRGRTRRAGSRHDTSDWSRPSGRLRSIAGSHRGRRS